MTARNRSAKPLVVSLAAVLSGVTQRSSPLTAAKLWTALLSRTPAVVMGAWCLHLIISYSTNQVSGFFAMKPITARYLDVSRVNFIGILLEFCGKRQSSQCFPMDVIQKSLVDCSSRCFICSSASSKMDKIYIFGRSSCDVGQIIRSALNVDRESRSVCLSSQML